MDHLCGPHRRQSGDRGEEEGRIHDEDPADAHPFDDEAGGGGAEEAGGVECSRVEGDGVGEGFAGDQLGDEGLSGRGIERPEDPSEQRERIDVPEKRPAAEDEDAQDRGEDDVRHLRGLEQPPPLHPVDEDAGPRR